MIKPPLLKRLIPTLTSTMPWEQLVGTENLTVAWRKVRANGGGAGVDGQTLRNFEAHLADNIAQLREELASGRYRPQQVLRVYVPKASGGRRPLGIYAIRDRIVQRAVHDAIAPLFERRFLPCSFAFRPQRSLHDAVAYILKQRDAGQRWVVDGDIKDCFERLDHDVLMRAVSVEVKEPQVLRLIQLWLKAKVMNEVDGREMGFGVVQGGAISPLLSNVYLHAFDERMTRAGLALVRYADDWIVLSASEADARAALNQVMDALAKLKLAIHPQKTWVTHFDRGFSFRGVFFLRGEHFYLSPAQAPAGGQRLT